MSNFEYDNSYQRYNIELADSILGDRDTYLDGVGMIAKREHVLIPELVWLDKMRLRRIHKMPKERRSEVLRTLAAEPPLLVVRNYRVLPRWLGPIELAPELGEHTAEVMRSELGLSVGEIDSLMAEGVLGDSGKHDD